MMFPSFNESEKLCLNPYISERTRGEIEYDIRLCLLLIREHCLYNPSDD